MTKIKITRDRREVLISEGYHGKSTLEDLNKFLEEYDCEICYGESVDLSSNEERFSVWLANYFDNFILQCSKNFINEDEAIDAGIEKAIEVISTAYKVGDENLEDDDWFTEEIDDEPIEIE